MNLLLKFKSLFQYYLSNERTKVAFSKFFAPFMTEHL